MGDKAMETKQLVCQDWQHACRGRPEPDIFLDFYRPCYTLSPVFSILDVNKKAFNHIRRLI